MSCFYNALEKQLQSETSTVLITKPKQRFLFLFLAAVTNMDHTAASVRTCDSEHWHQAPCLPFLTSNLQQWVQYAARVDVVRMFSHQTQCAFAGWRRPFPLSL